MLTDEQGRAKCVACGLCPQICPAKHQADPGRGRTRQPLSADLRDRRVPLRLLRLLPEVCPEEAIHVGVHYENSEYSRERFVYDLDASSQTHPVSTLWDPSDPRGE